MAHGYFEINLDVVWETVQEWLPELLKQLPAVREDARRRRPQRAMIGWWIVVSMRSPEERDRADQEARRAANPGAMGNRRGRHPLD